VFLGRKQIMATNTDGFARGTSGAQRKFMKLSLTGIAVIALFSATNAAQAALPSGSGDVVVNVNNSKIVKLSAVDGAVVWSVDFPNAGALTVDPVDLSVHAAAETASEITSDGALTWGHSFGESNNTPMPGMNFNNSYEGVTAANPADGAVVFQVGRSGIGGTNWNIDLASYVNGVDALAVQPWQGGYVYAASVASSKIVVVDPTTRTVVTSFSTAVPPRFVAINPEGGNVYIADGQNPFVLAYGPTGSTAWVNLNVGGVVSSIATPKGLIGSAAFSACPAPTVRVTTTAASLHKGSSAIIDFKSNNICAPIVVQFSVVTHAQAGVDYSLTDSFGNDVTVGGSSSGPLTLTALYNSRRRILPISILLLPDPAYYRANTKVTLQLLSR
jgi:YVTN family beta-propeller protein